MKQPLPLRNIATLLTSVTMLILSIAAQADGVYTHPAKFNFEEQSLTKKSASTDAAFTTVKIKDAGFYGKAGAPELPTKAFRFLVPTLSKDYTVKVSWPEARQIKLASPIKPVQKDHIIGTKAEITAPDKDAYSITYKPQAWIMNDYFVDGSNHIVTVSVSPVGYDPEKSMLYLYDSADISLSYKDANENEMSCKPLYTEKPDRTLDLASMVVNYSGTHKSNGFHDEQEYNAGTYVIVTSDSLVSAFDKLATWKRHKGYNVIVRTIESIRNDNAFSGGDLTSGINDDAGKLRAYLQSIFRQHGRSFVLLGGDYNTNFPIRYGTGEADIDVIRFHSDIYAVPTDLYFSDMTGNWNVDGNSSFGEFSNPLEKPPFQGGDDFTVPISPSGDSVNYYPDMKVGRLLCKTPQEVKNYTQKLILYEMNPGRGDVSYLSKAFVSRATDIDSNDVFQSQTTPLLMNSFSSLESMMKLSSNNIIFDGNDVINEMNNHYGFNIIDGHGSPQKIGAYNNTSGYVYSHGQEAMAPTNTGSISELTNDLYPSILYSTACSTTPFDQYSMLSGLHYFGSAYTSAGLYGGIAYIGNTRVGHTDASAKFERKLIEKFAEAKSIGDVFGLAKNDAYNDAPINKLYHHIALTNSLIGDPELVGWTSASRPLNIGLTLNPDGVLTLSGNDLANACVTIYNGQEIVECSKDLTGYRSYYVLDNPANCSVTVTKPGYLPYSAPIELDGYIQNTRNYITGSNTVSATYSLIGNGGHVTIHAAGDITITGNIIIAGGGVLEIISDGIINLESGTLDTGGCLITRSRGVAVQGRYFQVKPGSIWSKSRF